jgi:DNA-binding CsgD family transcriptional regulator
LPDPEVTDAVRLAVASGDDETLHKVVDNLARLASNTESPVVHAFHDWVSGWRLCDFVPAEHAAPSMAGCRRGAEAARAHHDAAVLAATAGSVSDARRLATVAFAGYEQPRAEQLHARLRSELRARGVSMRPRRVPPRPASGWEGLTPTERQVVDLVADGLTNGQIADQLFISRRTVESYLLRGYPKLGFHRRAELVVAARQRGDEEAGVSHPFA